MTILPPPTAIEGVPSGTAPPAPAAPASGGPVDGLSVADVLELDVLQAGEPEVLAGAAALRLPVRWVHIAEDAATSALLDGGELVLTTGMNFRHSAPAARDFLDRFFAAGAVAVIVEIADGEADDVQRSVAAVREAAREAAGPVVVLHARVRYVQVTEQVHRLLMEQQLSRVQRARQVHEVFTALSLHSATEQDIVDRTAELLGAPVVFEDSGHRVLSYNALGTTPARLLEGWPERSRWVRFAGTTSAGTGEEGAGWLQTPVGVAGQRWGRLVVPVARADEVDATQVLERAGQALTMARMAGRDRAELLHQARSGLLHALRQSPGPGEQEALARAEALGLVAGAVYVPVVARLDREPGESPTGLQLRERELLAGLEGTATAARLAVLAASIHAGAVGLLLSVPARELEDSVLERLFGSALPGSEQVSVGVGARQGTLVGAAAALDEAHQVAEIAATLENRHRRYYRFADVRLRGLLAVMADDARVRLFARAELAGLLDPDDEDGLQLLEAFLRHGGNKSELARSGYVSRQALYPRLARLEQRLGVSLDDPESRTALHVAVLWLRQERHGGALPRIREQDQLRTAP